MWRLARCAWWPNQTTAGLQDSYNPFRSHIAHEPTSPSISLRGFPRHLFPSSPENGDVPAARSSPLQTLAAGSSGPAPVSKTDEATSRPATTTGFDPEDWPASLAVHEGPGPERGDLKISPTVRRTVPDPPIQDGLPFGAATCNAGSPRLPSLRTTAGLLLLSVSGASGPATRQVHCRRSRLHRSLAYGCTQGREVHAVLGGLEGVWAGGTQLDPRQEHCGQIPHSTISGLSPWAVRSRPLGGVPWITFVDSPCGLPFFGLTVLFVNKLNCCIKPAVCHLYTIPFSSMLSVCSIHQGDYISIPVSYVVYVCIASRRQGMLPLDHPLRQS